MTLSPSTTLHTRFSSSTRYVPLIYALLPEKSSEHSHKTLILFCMAFARKTILKRERERETKNEIERDDERAIQADREIEARWLRHHRCALGKVGTSIISSRYPPVLSPPTPPSLTLSSALHLSLYRPWLVKK
jgi:hypothetical protein